MASSSSSACVNIVQISDLHLFADPDYIFPDRSINPQKNFEAVLAVLQREFSDMDLLAVTGDLLQEPTQDNYNHLFEQLAQLNVPTVAIAGNHDVTMELDGHLPFKDRRHMAVMPDARLVNRLLTALPHWDILWLDSSMQGHVAGCFSAETLRWLEHTLASSDKPCIIFTHHPMAKVNSAWIDQHWLKNAVTFWETVKPYTPRIKGIFTGHVHQEAHLFIHGVSIFTCPSTCVQFKPFAHDFTFDTKPPGFRWLTLYNNGTLATGIKRIDTI